MTKLNEVDLVHDQQTTRLLRTTQHLTWPFPFIYDIYSFKESVESCLKNFWPFLRTMLSVRILSSMTSNVSASAQLTRAVPDSPVSVGVYRLFTDDKLRPAVWAKVKHATIRGLVVAGVYVAATWRVQKWIVENFLMGGFSLFGKKAQAPPAEVLETSLSWLKKADVVDCKSNEVFPR